MEDHRTDRLGVLLDQFDRAREIAQARLDGLASPASLPEGSPLAPRKGEGPLSDEEYLWEPAPGAWSIRHRGQAASPRPFGPGEWQLDGASGDPDPTPVTTIAWRLGHLHADFAGRWEWTFGERRRPPAELVDFSPSAAVALERFWAMMDRWRASVAAMTPEQLDTVGFGQYPHGSDPEEPFITVIAEANIELIHHMAEIALLRDLYRTRPTGAVGPGHTTHGPSTARLVRRAVDGRLGAGGAGGSPPGDTGHLDRPGRWCRWGRIAGRSSAMGRPGSLAAGANAAEGGTAQPTSSAVCLDRA